MERRRIATAGLTGFALATAGTAQAEVSSTWTLTSDYDFRGITQTAQDPALQVSLDWSGESGLYAGLWASNIDFGSDTSTCTILVDDGEGGQTEEDVPCSTDYDVEIDAILGFSGQINDDLGYDVGATYYRYEPDDGDIDYYEIYAGGSYGPVSGKVWYSPDYVDSSDSAWYAEANGELALPEEFKLVGHLGYSFGDYWDAKNELDTFFDYSIGLERSFGHFDAAVRWVDGSDLKELKNTDDDINSSDARVILSIATTFPWSSE